MTTTRLIVKTTAVIALAIAATFIKPIKAFASPYCIYRNTYYSNANFTTVVGVTTTESCLRVEHSGTNTSYFTHEDLGACSEFPSCSTGVGNCPCADDAYSCIDGDCSYPFYGG